ncbi:TonB family protein [Aestuariivirga sp.]|uniref:energy transducer TonB family protein n=1 Tax=Aestuariivirga sp. TaxID=2650926 RepID=UPI0039E71D81
MISARGLFVSVTVHALFAGWVVSAAPVAREVIEDAEAMPAVEVVLEVPPEPVAEPSQASEPQVAMAVDPKRALPVVEDHAEPEPSRPAPAVPAPSATPPTPVIATPALPSTDVLQGPTEITAPVGAPSIPAVRAVPSVPQSALREPDQRTDSLPVVRPLRQSVPTPEPQKAEMQKKKKQARATAAKPVVRKTQTKVKSAASRRAYAAASGRKAVASGGTAVDPGYKSRVLAKLRAAKRSPRGGASGRVMLSFRLSKSGGLLSAHIARSGGHPMLDQATLAMVRAAAPFPPMPASMSQTSMSFTVPVQYN